MANFDLGGMADKAKDFAGDKGQWLKEKYDQIESWASENTEEGKQKLLQEAKEHNVDVDENMQLGEIKNKIKAKLRDKFAQNRS